MKNDVCRILLCFLSLTAVGLAEDASSWVKVAPKGGNFSILMPVQPKEETTPQEEDGVKSTMHMYTAQAGKAIFIAAWVEYPPKTDLSPFYKNDRDAFLKSTNAKLVNETKLADGGFEFIAESDTGYYKNRIYLVGGNAYQIAAGYAKGQDEARNMDKFIGSLVLTKGP